MILAARILLIHVCTNITHSYNQLFAQLHPITCWNETTQIPPSPMARLLEFCKIRLDKMKDVRSNITNVATRINNDRSLHTTVGLSSRPVRRSTALQCPTPKAGKSVRLGLWCMRVSSNHTLRPETRSISFGAFITSRFHK